MKSPESSLRIRGLGDEISSLSHLPWHLPLEEWPEDPSLAQQRGISRHIVRLVRADDGEIYAVKETNQEFANREYDALRELAHRGAPAVDPIAVVEGRSGENGEELAPALVTRFLPYSLPYRVVLSGKVSNVEIENMANSLALLLVRLHLLGFWWGDCSLSNALFRRDAESYAAYLVDAETGEFHDQLSKGQREHDLEIVQFNVAAELEDISLSGAIAVSEGLVLDPVRASDAVIRRYRRLWQALTEPQLLDSDDRQAVERAMRSVQDLGFAVEEVEVRFDGANHKVSFTPKVVAPDYHKVKFRELVGLDVEELQAKRLLASFDRFYGRLSEPKPSKDSAAKNWLDGTFMPIIQRVPTTLRGRVEDAQLFHEVLEHRWYLGEKAGRDVGLEFAADDYITNILPFRMDSGTPVNL